LKENTPLASLLFRSTYRRIETINAEEYIALLTVFQHNATLKTISIYHNGSLQLTDDEDKQMAALLKKNYALESLPTIEEAVEVRAILRLNEAGRRYLIQDGSSISKGVEVLSAVSNEIDCVFLHLLENPRLCDRRAVEAASDSTDNGGSTNPVQHGLAQNDGKESRRQLT
jgi:hypothetical protein